MKTVLARDLCIGQKIVVPNYRDDDDCKETCIVHSVHTRINYFIGDLTMINLGVGRNPVEVPADLPIFIVED